MTLRNTIYPVSTICYEHLIERIFVSGNNCVSFEALPQASSPALLPSSPSCFSNLPLQPFLFPHPAFPQFPIPATFRRNDGCADEVFVFTFSFLLTSPAVNFFFLALLCCASLLLILVDGRKDIALLNKDAPALKESEVESFLCQELLSPRGGFRPFFLHQPKVIRALTQLSANSPKRTPAFHSFFVWNSSFLC